MLGFGFGSVWVWVVSKNRSLVWFGSKFFVLGLVRFGLHFENLVRFCSQNSELVATLVKISNISFGTPFEIFSPVLALTEVGSAG